MKKCRFLSILLTIIMVTCLCTNVTVEAKKKKTFTVTVPTSDYNDDFLMKDFFEDISTKVKQKGKNTVITCSTEKVEKCISDFNDGLEDLRKKAKKDKAMSDIYFNDNFTVLSIYNMDSDICDSKNYSEGSTYSLTIFSCMIVAPYMQLLQGVKWKNVDLTIEYYDANNNLLSSYSLKDSLK